MTDETRGRPDQEPLLRMDDDLVARCLDGRASPDDIRALEARLAGDPAFRQRWLEVATIDALLAQRGEEGKSVPPLLAEAAKVEEMASVTPRLSAGPRWLPARWLPLAAGAAGLVIGGFFATAVWAMVVPLVPSVVRILSESFEAGDPPAVTGTPLKTGVWGGDYTEVVGRQNGVVPAAGSRMLRFRRADFEGKPIEEGFSCSTHRLIDLRPYRQQIAEGNCVLQISARFNTQADAGDQRDQCGVSMAAVDAVTAFDGSLRKSGELKKRALAYAWCYSVDLDRDVATWQQTVTEMRVPVGADFLLLVVGVNEFPPVNRGAPTAFAGHYCDDIRVSLVERQPVP